MNAQPIIMALAALDTVRKHGSNKELSYEVWHQAMEAAVYLRLALERERIEIPVVAAAATAGVSS